ncbi:glycosyltransferase family 1 protein [bacterium]|nr:glycosyltransferase family 1 protein [bacterium]
MKVLIISGYTKSLLWFRIDFMDELVAAGHEVTALGSDDDDQYRQAFRQHGVDYESFSVSRNGISPFGDLRTYRELLRALRRLRPDKVFVYQAKPIVYGCVAARRAGVSDVYPLVAGLGSVFRSEGLRNRLIRIVLTLQYRQAFAVSKKVFVQNSDDESALVAQRIVSRDQTVMLNGSGVNLEKYASGPLPQDAAFIFVGRLIRDKGVVEYLEACAQIVSKYPGTRCFLVGPFDTNPSALSPGDLAPYLAEGKIEYCGEQEDVRPFIERSSVFVLPSYHEGTPKSVLEAMAMGRAVITTDAPGCRETVTEGVNGFLVPPRQVGELVDRMERFIREPGLRERMGQEGRRIAEEKYDVHKVNQVILSTMGLDTVSVRKTSKR